MSAITLVASEFGNLMNFEDSAMVNIFIDLWDGRKSFTKETKFSGSDTIDSPWINMLACTTPSWISDNMSNNVIGGGFTSRCIFVYADKKERYSAYLEDAVPDDLAETRQKLLEDLEHIALTHCGKYTIAKDAKEWGQAWYQDMWENSYDKSRTDFHNGYIARKQTHLHKLAIVLAAAQRDELLITRSDLELAKIMLETTEANHSKIFTRIGRNEDSLEVERVIDLIKFKKRVHYKEVVAMLFVKFPSMQQIKTIIEGAVASGQIKIIATPEGPMFEAAS